MIINFASAMEDCYVDGRPKFLTDKANSAYFIIPYSEFVEMSVAVIHERLATKNIVLTGMPDRGIRFNEQGMKVLGGYLDQPIDIHGMYNSIKIYTYTHISSRS
jgi:hypothetical protein